MNNWAEYKQVVEREQLVRDACFMPILDSIGPFEVKPMALRHFLALSAIGNPFVAGGTPTPDDAFLFLWQVSPDYDPKNYRAKRKLRRLCKFFMPGIPWFGRTKRWKKQTRKRLVCFEQMCLAIRAYVDEAFQDKPPAKDSAKKASYYSIAANFVDTFGTEYSWSPETTLAQPLKALHQYLILIRARDRAKAGKPPVFFNPSDELLGLLVSKECEN